MLLYSDLVRVAELIKAAAEMAKVFNQTVATSEVSNITALANQIEAAARKLADIGQAEMDAREG